MQNSTHSPGVLNGNAEETGVSYRYMTFAKRRDVIDKHSRHTTPVASCRTATCSTESGQDQLIMAYAGAGYSLTASRHALRFLGTDRQQKHRAQLCNHVQLHTCYLQECGVAFLLANLLRTVEHPTVGSLGALGHEAGLDDI